MTPRAWIARLAFSFLIVAFALGWRAHTLWAHGDTTWHPSAMVGGAAICLTLGGAGIRLRHATPTQESPRE